MRIFLDTNVLFAATASRGLCADVLRALLADHDVIIGEPVLIELRRNLIAKLRLSPARADQALWFLEDLEHVPAVRRSGPTPPGVDAADAAILECAAHAAADAFVTGDKALLALTNYRGMPILSPRALWSQLRVKP